MSNPAKPASHTVEIEFENFPTLDLAVRKLEGSEAVSALYRFSLLLVSKGQAGNLALQKAEDLLGTPAKLRFYDKDKTELRAVSGIVSSVRMRSDAGVTSPTYEIEVVPRAWMLGLASTQEIFLNKSVVEIIQEKIDRLELGDYVEFRTTATYDKLEFVLQYMETDLAFVSRLAEHVGMSFHFEETGEGDKIVFSDHQSGFGEIEGALPYVPRGETHGVHELALVARLAPDLHAVLDYDYRNPGLDLGAQHARDAGLLGIVDYGTHHRTPELGKRLAQIRAEETASRANVREGRSSMVELFAGARIELGDDPLHDTQELLVVEVRHALEQSLGQDDAGKHGYENSFTAVPEAQTFRPARKTPRPRMEGLFTAVIQVGPEGETAGTAEMDEHGRYWVQFHFDAADHAALKASHPVRMAQPFAGPSQGMHFPLTRGTEVMIAFVNGDPDRPVIVGAVPNHATPNVVTNAAQPHMHRIKSQYGLTVEFGKATAS